MKRRVKTLAVVLVGAGLVAFAAAPALCADEFCAMGGTLIKVEVDKEKALEWGKDRRKVVIAGEDGDQWSVLTICKSDNDIALLVKPGSVFFGVAGKGGQEVDSRDADKIYGKDLDDLKEAVQKELTELWKADVVKVQGKDIQEIVKVVGLGTLENDRDWKLTTEDCKGTDLDASDLK